MSEKVPSYVARRLYSSMMAFAIIVSILFLKHAWTLRSLLWVGGIPLIAGAIFGLTYGHSVDGLDETSKYTWRLGVLFSILLCIGTAMLALYFS